MEHNLLTPKNEDQVTERCPVGASKLQAITNEELQKTLLKDVIKGICNRKIGWDGHVPKMRDERTSAPWYSCNIRKRKSTKDSSTPHSRKVDLL